MMGRVGTPLSRDESLSQKTPHESHPPGVVPFPAERRRAGRAAGDGADVHCGCDIVPLADSLRDELLQKRPAVRLFLVDDHEIVRAAVRMLVEQVDDFVVVGEARDAGSAIEDVARKAPDVVITDLILGQSEADGLRAIREIRAAVPSCRVLVLSMHDQPAHVRQALEAGAHGYTAKLDEWRELVIAVRTLAGGETYLSTAVADWERNEDDRLSQLTPRQREILRLIAEGYRTREIAQMLGVSVKTVETHRTQLMQRLDLHNIADLTRLAMEVGLVPNG
jgi:DNA-binding NarL/FixJ family response regulator